MRTDILNYMLSQNLGVITTSQELPWDSDGVALYVKNLKKVYVSESEVQVEPLIATLDGAIIDSEVTSVKAYVACDAKQLPPNFSDAVTVMRDAKDVVTDAGIRRRDCLISRSYDNDILVTELEFRFTKLLT